MFARALAAKDFDGLVELFDPGVDFRALTPNRTWEATGPDDVITGVLREWFDADDDIQALEWVETHEVADRERVAYRFRVRNTEGEFLVEQQGYLTAADGRIVWMRMMCSGFRPV